MAWIAFATLLLLPSIALVVGGSQFSPDHELLDVPALSLSLGLVTAGLIALAVLPLLTLAQDLDRTAAPHLLAIVIAAGLAQRLIMMATEPALEIDWARYLWDGAMTANGHNPYALAPAEIDKLMMSDPRARLAAPAEALIARISYPEYRTVYPPVAQAAFALAHLIEPFSLRAWRLVCFSGEIVTLCLLLRLLAETGRPPLWVAIYWLHPLVAKELINSAHMEAVLVPFVLAALLLAIRGWSLASIAALGLAAGVKLWPLMLAPLLLAPMLAAPFRLAAAAMLLLGVLAVLAAPVVAGGLGETSGFIAYATHWKTNSALFPLLERGAVMLTAPFGVSTEMAGRLLRALLALAVLALAIWLARRPMRTAADLTRGAFLIVSALVLLSPAQFPWYVIWVLPLVAVHPSAGWLLAAALVPMYYAAFHFHARDTYGIYRDWIVWAIWLPVWLTLLREALNGRRSRSGPGGGTTMRHRSARHVE